MLIDSPMEHKIVVHSIILCETYLNDKNMNHCSIPGYNVTMKNRNVGKGGGVAIYIIDSLTFTRREDLMVNVDR